MLDIKGIKQKINEVLHLNENNDSIINKLFDVLKSDEEFKNVFIKNNGDDTKFEDILMARCEEYAYNSDIYQLDKKYQDISWFSVGNLIFNYDEIWDDWAEYCKNLYDDEKIENPKDDGYIKYLEEQVLMEMPATNYMTFDIEPYILCDETYEEDDEGNIIEGISYMPFYDYVTGERFSRYDWVNDYTTRNYDTIQLPDLNNNLNNDLVRIIGYSGYYDGMSVGIIARDIDTDWYDLRWDYFYEDYNDPRKYIKDNKSYTQDEAIKLLKDFQDKEIEKARDILLEANDREGGKVVPSSYAYKVPTETGAEMMDESVLKENTDNVDTLIWLRDHPYFVRYGEEKTVSYKGYDINIEGCIEDYDDYSREHYYHLQFYISDIENDDEARVYETDSPQTWEDMCDTIEEYIEEHPLEDYSKPKDNGFDEWELDESYKQLNESDNDFEFWRRREPLEADTETSFEYKGYYIEVENMEDDHFNVRIYKPNTDDLEDEFYTYEWSRIFDVIIEYERRHPVNQDSDESENDNPPKDDGAKGWEIDESYQQLNEKFEKWEGSDTEIIGSDESRDFKYKGCKIFTYAEIAEFDEDGEEIVVYYARVILNNGTSKDFSDESWMNLCNKVTKYINENSNFIDSDDIIAPKDNGYDEWELDESYKQLNENVGDDWDLNTIPDIIGTDETAIYNFYDYEIKFDSQQIHGIDYYNAHIIQDGRQIILYTMENWNDLCRKVSQWLKLHSDYEQKQMLDSYNFSKNVLTNLKVVKELYDYYCNNDKIEQGFENDAYENMVWYMTDFIDKVIFDIRSKYTYDESADVLKTLYETRYAFKDIVIDYYKRYVDIDYFEDCNEYEDESWEDLMEHSNLSDMIRYIVPDKQYECVDVLYDKFMTMVNELESLFKIKAPEDTGAEWIEENRNLDIKNIKKQINEIVRIVG